MTVEFLDRIIIHFPKISSGFITDLCNFLNPIFLRSADVYKAIPSNESYFPKIYIDPNSEKNYIMTDFVLSNSETISVNVQNITEMDKQNPSVYNHIELEDVIRRLSKHAVEILSADHIGFNLPWFNKGLHPDIIDLRNRLNANCLYYCFPTGEPWDFIIPGEVVEINKMKSIDYSQTRKPKFEIVSFENASTPLIQIDIAINLKYSKFRLLFPEALDNQNMKNVWLYLANSYNVDICMVLNEYAEGDWSHFFKGHRLE